MDKEKIIIDLKQSRIIKDERQISVRIPSIFALEFLVNPNKDGFLWTIEKEDKKIFLRGELVKNIDLEK